jgi:hypothetical protein
MLAQTIIWWLISIRRLDYVLLIISLRDFMTDHNLLLESDKFEVMDM